MRRILPVFALFFSACGLVSSVTTSSGLKVDANDKERLKREFVGREYVLASSMFVGDFFGDTSKRLIDPRPADIIELSHHSGERAVVAPFSSEIIWAGTPVKVSDIVYPAESVTAVLDERSELMPTAHSWVVLERTDKKDVPLVLVLPRDIATLEAFREAVIERLASMEWVASFLSNREAKVLDHIYRKSVVEGMSRAEMLAALGHPKNAGELKESGALDFTADYGDLQVSMSGNLVTKVVSLKQAAAEARLKAADDAEKARIEDEKRRAEMEAARKKSEEEARIAAKAREEEEAVRRKIEGERLTKERAAEERQRQAELRRLEAEEKKRLEREELERKKAEAQAAKELAQREASDKAELARLAAEAKKAEAQADKARASANAESKRARAEVDKEIKAVEVEIARVKKKLEPTIAAARAERDKAEARLQKSLASLESRRDAAKKSYEAAMTPRKPAAGELARGRMLGIRTKSVSSELAKEMKMPRASGAYVVEAKAGESCALAGVEANDVILTFDGNEVANPKELVAQAAVAPQDRKVYLEIWRNGRTIVLSLPGVEEYIDQELAARTKAELDAADAELERARAKHGAELSSADGRLAAAQSKVDEAVADLEAKLARAQSKLAQIESGVAAPAASVEKGRKLGLRTKGVELDEARRLGVDGGAMIVEVKTDGAGASAGIKKDDIIVAFDGQTVRTTQDLASAAGAAPRDRKVFIEVLRGKERVVLTLPAETQSEPPAMAGRKPPEPAPVLPVRAEEETQPAPAPEKRPDNRHLIPKRSDSGG